MAIFLTGATGYIGAHVAANLLQQHDSSLNVLVRGRSPQDAAERLVGTKNLNVLDVWQKARLALEGNRPRAARDAVDFIGLPEGNLALAQAVVYLSIAPKSNALYTAYGSVTRDVEQTAADPVPLHLRNAPTSLMKGLGYGQGYQYAHEVEGKVANMQCLPESLRGKVYYQPTNEGIEKRIRERLEEIKKRRGTV